MYPMKIKYMQNIKLFYAEIYFDRIGIYVKYILVNIFRIYKENIF